MRLINAGDVAQLIRELRPCAMCQVIVDGGAPAPDDTIVNAIAIDPAGYAHAGDVVTGRVVCGPNAARWQWLVERNAIAAIVQR